MNLIEVYSTHSGLQIDKPIIVDDFVPLSCDNYITFHAGGGQNNNFPAKMYSYWQFVIALLKEAGLKEKIVQIGEAAEPLMPGVDVDMRGQTKWRQSFYIVKGAKLHMGNCSFPGHVAGAYNVPEVILYGPTVPWAHAPYWHHPKSVFLESDRGGRKPSFSSQEDPRTIDMIHPEQVAAAVLSILGYPAPTVKTVYMGKMANQHLLEYIPNFPFNPAAFPAVIPSIRLDYHFDQQNAFQFLSQRKGALITNKELELGPLKQLKPNIGALHYEITAAANLKYLNELKRVGVPLRFFSRAKDAELAALRLQFFDLGNIFPEVDNEKKIEGAAKIRTNKIVLSEGKFYASRAHEKLKIEIDTKANSSTVLDDLDFWKDQEFMWFYNE